MNSQNTPNNNLAKLPPMSFVFIKSNAPGSYIGAVKKGESGYFKTDYDERDPQKAKEIVDYMNGKLGVTKVQAECMYNGSLFGWDTPGANHDYISEKMPELAS